METREGPEEIENVCYSLLSSVVSYIPFHGYLLVLFCMDLKNTIFILLCVIAFQYENCFAKHFFKLGHSAEVCIGLIMIILLPWAFSCSLNLLKYYFIAGAKNLQSNQSYVAPGMHDCLSCSL